MNEHGLPLGYAGTAPPPGYDTRRPAPPIAGRVRAALRRTLDAVLDAQLRVAGAPWDGGWPGSAAAAVADRVVRRGAAAAARRR